MTWDNLSWANHFSGTRQYFSIDRAPTEKPLITPERQTLWLVHTRQTRVLAPTNHRSMWLLSPGCRSTSSLARRIALPLETATPRGFTSACADGLPLASSLAILAPVTGTDERSAFELPRLYFCSLWKDGKGGSVPPETKVIF